jgi:hypothetical protein
MKITAMLACCAALLGALSSAVLCQPEEAPLQRAEERQVYDAWLSAMRARLLADSGLPVEIAGPLRAIEIARQHQCATLIRAEGRELDRFDWAIRLFR